MRPKYLPQDNEARLVHGICFHNGKPYNIASIMGTNCVLETLNPKKGEPASVLVALDDPTLDVSAPKLGYVNYKKSAYYVVRWPYRQYKQTLQTKTVSVYGMSNFLRISSEQAHAMLYSSAGEAMLLGNYPNIDNAIENLTTDKISQVAVHRYVGLRKNEKGQIEVYYKLDQVGILDTVAKTVSIPKGDFAWVISKYLEEFDWKVE